MDCIELSLENLEEKCKEWAIDIKNQYSPDLIVFVAKAGYPIAVAIAEKIGIPLIGVETTRKGNGLKDTLSPVLCKIPNWFRNLLIMLELKSGIHQKKDERIVNFVYKDNIEKYQMCRKILIVDDSIDTGNSMLNVIKFVQREFPDAQIKCAGLNVWDMSKKNVNVEFNLFSNTIIKAPMSKDSTEYQIFKHMYLDYLEELRKHG